jgi:3-deoxy-D-manno-octulosonic-acid transferase
MNNTAQIPKTSAAICQALPLDLPGAAKFIDKVNPKVLKVELRSQIA